MIRTHDAGSLRAADIGETVALAGWVARRRDHGGVAFIDLRDASGVAQVVIRDEEAARPLRSEFCLRVVGEVAARPAGNANPQLASGEIEVVAAAVEVLSESAPLPFPIEEHSATPIGEELRLRTATSTCARRDGTQPPPSCRRDPHRPRRHGRARLPRHRDPVPHPVHTGRCPRLPGPRQAPAGLVVRAAAVTAALQAAADGGGAGAVLPDRALLPRRGLPGRPSARVQPARHRAQLLHQSDVQPVEELLVRLWRELLGHEIPLPIPQLTYAEAMRRYGIDRPDLRFGCELVDFTEYFTETPFRVVRDRTGEEFYVGAVVMPGGASQARGAGRLAGLGQVTRRGGLAYVLVGDDGPLGGPVAKNLSESERAGLAAHAGASPGDCIFFAAGKRSDALNLLAATRVEVGERCGLIDHDAWEFVWVVAAPMFEPVDGPDGSGWTAIHHPFTAPADEFADDFHLRPGRLCRRRTTSSSTDRRSAAAPSASTALRCSSGSST